MGAGTQKRLEQACAAICSCQLLIDSNLRVESGGYPPEAPTDPYERN